MPIKLDASAIIYLTKSDLLDLLPALYDEVIITEAVYNEAVVQGKAAGHRDADLIDQAIGNGQIRVVSLSKPARERLRAASFPPRLGLGEQETIVEALNQACPAVLDDRPARAASAAMGVRLCGSDTILLAALFKGRLTPSEFSAQATKLATVMGLRADALVELLYLGQMFQEAMEDDEQQDNDA